MFMSTASCALDPMPTPFVKSHSDALISVITSLVNASLSSGHVPGSLKVAVVMPCLKKTGMDVDESSSYRPIFNLSYISKVLEKVVASRITAHMTEHHLHEAVRVQDQLFDRNSAGEGQGAKKAS